MLHSSTVPPVPVYMLYYLNTGTTIPLYPNLKNRGETTPMTSLRRNGAAAVQTGRPVLKDEEIQHGQLLDT